MRRDLLDLHPCEAAGLVYLVIGLLAAGGMWLGWM